ncbi:hypothetical protein [Mesorhizobium erdmanii]|uniref:Uncharacterized protein n=1 Tax=Mesorhizobium erdmanii TaxID=1777866 RepID=A0A6M7UB61_9HYPH|nr:MULTISPECIES: hypothetical protein [Mesorhizobium]OBQ67805.1 hypothetical protein A8146_10185 [Mesorhizobium loti]QKC74172.1 hypothetical protein EB233_00420 [Mesorhizobium erdmanii]
MFITKYDPPKARAKYVEDGIELKFTEAAVMLAFAFSLLKQATGEAEVFVHPDGEHAKVFDISALLTSAGFDKVSSMGSTAYAGRYIRGLHAVTINPRSGLGDVVANINGVRFLAECKGGTVNTTHPGQKSRLRKGLSELIGQLMILRKGEERQVAVLPHTAEVERLGLKLRDRCARAGIEIALVHHNGEVAFL